MVEESLLSLPPDHIGRKAGKTAVESDLTIWEDQPCYDWQGWFLERGGFKSCGEVDVNNWPALYHALDSMSFSARLLCFHTIGAVDPSEVA